MSLTVEEQTLSFVVGSDTDYTVAVADNASAKDHSGRRITPNVANRHLR